MSVVYLDRDDLDVSSRDGRLRIACGEGAPRFVPIAGIEQLVVAANVALPANALAQLGEAGATVTVLRPRHDARAVALIGNPHADVDLRLAQYRHVANASLVLPIASAAVSLKHCAQRHALRRYARQRPDARVELHRAEAALLAMSVDAVADADTLRGIEGAMARAYYAGLRAVLPGSLGFASRQRRPPPDPVNAALSLGYTLLHGRALRAAWVAGLDPMLGFLHAPQRGRDSLACDLAEPLRPALDAMVWRLFADKQLRAEHFARQGAACLLDKTGRGLFYAAFEREAPRWQRKLLRLARRLRRHLLEQTR